jgi:uncharacterized protein (TIGR03083 family)
MRSLAPEDYTRAIREDGLALAVAAEGRLANDVPSCPGWSVADLLWHIGEVHRFWNQIAAQRLLDPEEAEEAERPAEEDLISWYEEGLAELLSTLGSADPDDPVWSWASPEPVPTAWIHRRMAQETAMHRWDAQDAAGEGAPIETDLAADGIDEFLTWFLDGDQLEIGAETVGFAAADTGDSWVARVADGELTVRPSARASALGPVEAQVEGSASDLLLLLWRRIRLDSLEISGDPAALARFIRRAELV